MKTDFKKVIMATKLTILVILIVGAFGFAAVTAAQEKTYSQDEVTVANTTDGEQVRVTYEVSKTEYSDLSQREERTLMQDMQIVSSCSNEHLDSFIEAHSYQQVNSSDLNSEIKSCEQDGIQTKVLIK